MTTTFILSSIVVTGASNTKYFNASAVTSTGDIYIQGNGSDLNIYVYDSTLTLKTTITGVSTIYVAACYDSSNNRVYLAGTNRFGVINVSNNAYSIYSSAWLNGVSFSVADGFVYATTNTGYIIQKINPSNGAQTNIFTTSGNIISDTYGTFAGCAIDRNNYLYCTTRGIGYIYKFNTSGEILQLFSTVNALNTYGNIWGLTCDTNTNNLYVSSVGTPGAIYKISSSGVSSVYAITTYSSNSVSYDIKNNRLIATDQNSTGTTSSIYIILINVIRLYVNNSNLLYYYPLDTDLLNYASGTGVNDATYTTSITTSATTLTSGSLNLNGTNNMFKVPGHAYQAGGITICMWMKSKTMTPNWYHLFSFGNGQGSDNILLGFTGSDVGNLRVFYILFNGTTQLFRTNLAYKISDLNWHHYCLTIEPNGAWKVYIDGINQNVTNVGYPNTVTRATCYIGNSFWGDPGMVAYINQILIFNRTLTSTEVAYLANYPSAITFSNLPSQVITSLDIIYPCFREGSKILKLDPETDEEYYVPVETLRRGDLIKTATCGYKAVAFIGKGTLRNPVDDPDKKNRLYKFKDSKKRYPPLYITGEHCLLYKENEISVEKRREVKEHMGDDYITETYHRVPACLDDKGSPYDGGNGPATIWHFALEHNNLYNNYAVWANGILVETCSIDFLTKNSRMELV